jgi:hypothetical protein
MDIKFALPCYDTTLMLKNPGLSECVRCPENLLARLKYFRFPILLIPSGKLKKIVYNVCVSMKAECFSRKRENKRSLNRKLF